MTRHCVFWSEHRAINHHTPSPINPPVLTEIVTSSYAIRVATKEDTSRRGVRMLWQGIASRRCSKGASDEFLLGATAQVSFDPDHG